MDIELSRFEPLVRDNCEVDVSSPKKKKKKKKKGNKLFREEHREINPLSTQRMGDIAFHYPDESPNHSTRRRGM